MTGSGEDAGEENERRNDRETRLDLFSLLSRNSEGRPNAIVVLGPTVDADEEKQKRCAELLVREVLPAFSG